MPARDRFIEVMREAILSLAYDVKAFMRLVEDPDLDEHSRVEAAGALLHLLSAQNAIPGLRGLLAYVDDAIVLRLVLERAHARSPEAVARHRDESSQLLDAWQEQLVAIRDFLGAELMPVLERAAEGVSRIAYEGHTAEQCAAETESMNWLYDEIQEKALRLDVQEDEVVRALKQVDQILPPLRAKAGVRP
jgi:uncharacterized membrane protein YkvA (DUF1232 family)